MSLAVRVAALWCAAAVAVVQAVSWPSDAQTFQLRMTTLVLCNSGSLGDKSVAIARQVLDGFGTDWEALDSLPDMSQPNYNAIVFSRRADPSEVEVARAYSLKYGTRIVYLIGDFDSAGDAVSQGSVGGNYIVFDSSPYAVSVGDALATNKGWPVGDSLSPASAVASHASTQPLLRYSETASPSTTGRLAAFTTSANGPEEMYFMWDATRAAIYYEAKTNRFNLNDVLSVTDQADTYMNMAMATMWFTWATRGVFAGQRRVHLSIQPDDWFMPSDIYGSTGSYRCNAEDCQGAVDEMDYINSISPPGSSFKIELPFNGLGWKMDGNRGLNRCSEVNRDKFFWVSHTYSHQHLDWAGGCTPEGLNCNPTSPGKVGSEIDKNVELINGDLTGNMFYEDPEGLKAYFSSKSLVTPEISGLVPSGFTPPYSDVRIYGRPRNVESLSMLESRGIRYVTGDNSRTETMPKNPHHALKTNVERWGVDSIFILPRQATVIDYNVPDPEVFQRFYEGEGACHWQVGQSCANFRYTFDGAIRREVFGNMFEALQYRMDPYMMHQINLKLFDYNGKQRSMLGIFAEGMVQTLTEYLDGLPVITMKMDSLGKFFEDRMARDACGLTHKANIVNGTLQGFAVTGSASCIPVITTTKNSIVQGGSVTGAESSYTYGPDRNYYMYVNPSSPSASLGVAAAKAAPAPAPVPVMPPASAPSTAPPIMSLSAKAALPAGRRSA